MKTKRPEQKTPPPRKAPVKRYLLYGFLVIAAIGVRLWFAGPKIPIPDLSDATPELETAVNAAAARIDEAPSSANAWGNYGMLLAAHQFTTEAVAVYDKAHELESRDWRWPYLKAVALEHVNPAQSLDALKQSVKLGGPLLELARALLEAGQPAEAEQLLRNDRDRYKHSHGDLLHTQLGMPYNPSSFLLLARAFIQQEKYDLARKALNDITQYDSTLKSAHELLSHVHSRLGNHEESAKARRIAETLPPDKPFANPLREKLARMHTSKEAYIAQVNQLRHLGRFDEVERVGHEGYAKFPELSFFSQGRTALLDGKPAEAEPAFRQALEIDPDWIDALIGLGDSLADQNKLAAAEDIFRNAIKLESSNGAAHLRLGQCLLKQDKSKPAVEAFRRAVEYLPLSADAHNGLADALAKAGRDAEANEHRQHARKLAGQTLERASPKKP